MPGNAVESTGLMPAEHEAPRIKRAPDRRLVPPFPTLWPHMLRRAASIAALPFPFSEPATRYYALARYGIYDIARAFELEGREVLFPAYFHSVELDALLAAGVRPRFYPVHEKMQVDIDEVARLVEPQTAAIYVIHYGGFPGPVAELADLCRARGIRLIEDAALALLSRLGDRPLGSFGDAAIFCLYKTVPVPTGGAVLLPGGWPASTVLPRPFPVLKAGTRAANLILLNLEMRGIAGARQLGEVARLLGRRIRRGASPHTLAPGATFDRRWIGMGVGPFVRRILPNQDYGMIVQVRRRNYQRLKERLSAALPPIFSDLPVGVCPLFYPFQSRSREPLLQLLRSRGLSIGEFWPEQHPAIPVGAFPEVDAIRQTALWLPCHQDLTDAAIDWMASVVLDAASRLG